MARIRTIKPEFWTDDRVGECSVSARLLFVASWNFADDSGGMDRSAKQLKAQAFPYDQINCEPLIDELLKAGLLVEYQVSGKKYLHIKGFRTHQKIEKPARPRYPVYNESLRTQRVVDEESGSSAVSSLEGSLREGNGSRGGVGEGGSDQTPQDTVQHRETPPVHDSLPIASWNEWLEHRRAKRWPVDIRTLRKQLQLLSQFDQATQRQMIDNSIQANWQGLFPPKTRKADTLEERNKAALANWQPPPDDPDVQHGP